MLHDAEDEVLRGKKRMLRMLFGPGGDDLASLSGQMWPLWSPGVLHQLSIQKLARAGPDLPLIVGHGLMIGDFGTEIEHMTRQLLLI